MNLELLKKLKALAERGIGGEKENAATKLQKMLERNGMTIDQLEIDETHRREFTMHMDTENLFFQICAHVLGTAAHRYYKNQKGKKRTIIIDTTDYEFVEINELYSFYRQKYLEEQKIFYKAFVNKNQLFKKGPAREISEMTAEEIEEYERIQEMMSGLKRHKPLKQLN